MKKYLVFLAVLSVILLLFYRWGAFDNNLIETKSSTSTLPTFENKQTNIIRVGNDEYRYVFFQIESSNKAKLIPNFITTKTSAILKKENSCDKLINGGFISEKGLPIGYFKTAEKVFSQQTNNALFIGFLLFDGNKFVINRIGPLPKTEFGIQSGPLLIEENQVLSVNLKSDKPARRMVWAIKDDGSSVALAIFGKESELEGPHLENLANIVKKIADKENWTLRDAINLDGGKHSVYFADKVNIPEIVGVGSIICVN